MESHLSPLTRVFAFRTQIADGSNRSRSAAAGVAFFANYGSGRSLRIGRGHLAASSSANALGHHTEEGVVQDISSKSEMFLPLKVSPGQPFPLGVSEVDNGINFSIFSENASSVTLCLSNFERLDYKFAYLSSLVRKEDRNFFLEVDFLPSFSLWVVVKGSDLVLKDQLPNHRIIEVDSNGTGLPYLDKFSSFEGVETLDDGMFEICLDPSKNRTGHVWHTTLEGLPRSGILYGYRVDGSREWRKGHRFDTSNVLLDPYAKFVEGRSIFGDTSKRFSKFFGTYDFDSPPFDWGSDYKLPNLSEKDLLIYEMNVRAFTADESSGLDPKLRGSYLGVIEKIPYLLSFGINAVELLPVFEFDELEFQRRTNTRDHMINTWGYSTINFFTPMTRYASAGGGTLAACREFKEMVKALHNAGIEVILDVVYNHTNEGDDYNPYTTSFRGIDNKVYYTVDLGNGGQLRNFSGCGNTVNCNHPVVMELILDSLRYWVNEYHVDGFRFDLASILCRGTDGSPLNAPPIIRTITQDAVLSRCKLIAEPWECGDLYLVGKFPNWDRWAEWNGKYRDDIRRFIKGDCGMKGSFATRVSGSSDLYQVNKRRPWHSVNFVVAHDGFTLYDLVTYNFKHNEANGEHGNDGSNDNFSWNCGHEGETADASINALRARQMKNFHLALMISQGLPMVLMGDEYGHTRFGNNNSYGHDNSLNNFQWNQLKTKENSQFRFFSEMIKFRLKHSILRHGEFLHKSDISWHEDNWDNSESKFLAFTLHDKKFGEDIYLAFNAHHYYVNVAIPSPPRGKRWHRVVDTNLASPDDFVPEGIPFSGSMYDIAPYSSILLEAKP